MKTQSNSDKIGTNADSAIRSGSAAVWEEVGFCGVDAGMLLIGDPCYFVRSDSEVQEKWNGDWSAFLRYIYARGGDMPGAQQLDYVKGHAGMGVVVDVDGDGSYPVMARRNAKGHIVEIRIRTGFEDEMEVAP